MTFRRGFLPDFVWILFGMRSLLFSVCVSALSLAALSVSAPTKPSIVVFFVDGEWRGCDPLFVPLCVTHTL